MRRVAVAAAISLATLMVAALLWRFRGSALLFVTSRAAAARVEVPKGSMIAAIAPTTSAALEARGIRVTLAAHGGVQQLAQAVVDSGAIPDGTEVFYPTSDAALPTKATRSAPRWAAGRPG